MVRASFVSSCAAVGLLAGILCSGAIAQFGSSPAPANRPAGRVGWQAAPFTNPSAIAYRRIAVDIGGKEWPSTIAFRCNANWPPVETGIPARGPVKVFDNLYYLGVPGVGEVTAWALTTSAGIVIIDTLNNPDEARDDIVAGLRKVGLDPKDIKYVLLTHEHGDHFGGAVYLREQFHPIFGMSQKAWDAMAQNRPGPGGNMPKPQKQDGDLVLTDGQKLTFGDTVVTAVLTPGHTPGATSFLIPVKENGQVHMAAMLGANRPVGSVETLRQFRRSLDHFEEFTEPANVDVEISIHGDVDDMLHRLDVLKARRPGQPNPFIVGREKYLRYEGVWKYCLDANIAEGRAP